MSAQDTIKKQITDNKIMLYMKGSPEFPQCGFSGKVAYLLNSCGVSFGHCNVLEDPEIRQGVKDYSNWPTIPQLYVNGDFIGGCDIVTEMYEAGELQTLLESV